MTKTPTITIQEKKTHTEAKTIKNMKNKNKNSDQFRRVDRSNV